MAVILKVIVIRHAQKALIITGREVSRGKELHPWFVVSLEGMQPCPADVTLILELSLVDSRYYLFRLFIQGIETRKDLFPEPFDQMRLQKSHMVFDRRLSFGFSRRRRKNDRIVEILQIREYRVQNQFILGMLCNCSF